MKGADWFSSIGTEKISRNKGLLLGGKINNTAFGGAYGHHPQRDHL